jgi:hypothetical protein
MDEARKALKSKQSLGESSLMSYLTSLVQCLVVVTLLVAVTGENKQVLPLPVKVTLAPMKVQVAALRGQPHGEKIDKTPALGEFTANPGVTQIPVDPMQETAVAELFFRDSFFDMLCQETNKYYLQHRQQRRHGQVKKPFCTVRSTVEETGKGA